jgi:hypothetical protein
MFSSFVQTLRSLLKIFILFGNVFMDPERQNSRKISRKDNLRCSQVECIGIMKIKSHVFRFLVLTSKFKGAQV